MFAAAGSSAVKSRKAAQQRGCGPDTSGDSCGCHSFSDDNCTVFIAAVSVDACASKCVVFSESGAASDGFEERS